MSRDAIIAVRKLTACVAVALILLLVSIFGGDAWYRPIAMVVLVIVAGPVVLLVATDTSRVLRREKLSRAAAAATRIPELVLGALATVGGSGGLALTVFTDFSTEWWRLWGLVVSVGLLVYGASLLRLIPMRTKDRSG